MTLTGGGNDVGWAPGILLSSLPRPIRAIPSVRRQLDSFADPDATELRFRALRDGSGSIDHVVNGTGAAVSAASPGPSDVVRYP